MNDKSTDLISIGSNDDPSDDDVLLDAAQRILRQSASRIVAKPAQAIAQRDNIARALDQRRQSVGQKGEDEVLEAIAELLKQNGSLSGLEVDNPSRQQLAASIRGLADAIDKRRHSVGPVRSQASHDAILDAAMKILAENGSAGFTFDAIAKRARAGKPSLYRRWTCRGELLFELIDTRLLPLLPTFGDIPDLGSVAKEIEAYLVHLWESITRDKAHEEIMWLTFAEAHVDESIARRMPEYMALRQAEVEGVLRRGLNRGDLPPGFDLEHAWRMTSNYNIGSFMRSERPDQSELRKVARTIVQQPC